MCIFRDEISKLIILSLCLIADLRPKITLFFCILKTLAA